MGYSDGYYYGQGRIICDTSTFSVGDTIRVRSVYNVSQTEDKQVVTVGTPLIFTVPPYDYYKICRVQTINDTPTEVGSEFVEIGFGDLHRSNVVDKTTLAGIQGILNSHTENYALNIGDEVTIKINDGGTPKDWVMQIAGINVYHDHDIMFTSKHIWSTASSATGYISTDLRTKVQNFYSSIDNTNKQYIKEVTRGYRVGSNQGTYSDYCFVLGNKETGNNSSYWAVSSQVQMPLFVTQSNRIKTYNGTALWYYLSDSNDTSNVEIISSAGALLTSSSVNGGVVPSFMLIADS